jgi:hypothetical protein
MTEITPETLKQTRKEPIARRDELIELQGVLANGDASVLDRHALVIEQILELKKTFIEQREALTVGLPDGIRLWRDQYEALERFASNNKLVIDTVLSGIKVEGGVVTECDFGGRNLTTLSGLEGLVRLRRLTVYGNQGLTSLKGIPTQAIEVIDARGCGLTGDHTFLSKGKNLKTLQVSANPALTLDKTKFNSTVGIYL